METPIRSVRYIHKAIKVDTQKLEDEVGRLAPDDMDGAGDIARRLDFLTSVVKTHEDGEESAIFPLVDERVYPVSAPYLLDHRTDQLHMREMVEAFERLATMRDAGERAGLLHQVSRQAIVLNAAMNLHVRKEEDLVVPLIEEHFSLEQQGDIVSAAVAHFTPEQLQVALPWIVKAQTLDDREMFLRGMMAIMPPPVFQMVLGWAQAALPESEWTELERRLPKAA